MSFNRLAEERDPLNSASFTAGAMRLFGNFDFGFGDSSAVTAVDDSRPVVVCPTLSRELVLSVSACLGKHGGQYARPRP